MNHNNQPSEIGSIAHTFQLRESLAVQFDLPLDLNPQEAKRLAMWIKSLPFMADDDGF